MLKKISNFIHSYINSIRSIPSILLTVFCVVIICMNLIASKTILKTELLAIDAGITITWIAIVLMDIVTISFGPKTAIRMSIFGLIVNLFASLVFFLISLIPSSQQYDEFKHVLGGSWYILVSSAAAFIVSSTLNATLNYFVGKLFKNNPEGKLAYCTRCFTSTFVSQFIDNLIFSSLAFMVFIPMFVGKEYGWSFVQVIMCALVYGGIDLVLECLVTPLAYRTYKRIRINK